MIAPVTLTLAVLALPAVVSCGYLLILTLLSGARPATTRTARRLCFDIIVPAHNEAAVIHQTIASLRELDWPQLCFPLIVVADNFEDATASAAPAARAQVYERHAPLSRGKGHALELSRWF